MANGEHEGMIMELRDDHRTHAAIKLLLYKAGLPTALAVTRDISNTGMFVQTSFVDVDPNQVLEFELLYNRKNASASKRYRATVVEKRNNGLALKFDEAHKRDARKLAAMVEWVANIYSADRQHSSAHRLVFISDLMRLQNSANESGQFNGVGRGLASP